MCGAIEFGIAMVDGMKAPKPRDPVKKSVQQESEKVKGDEGDGKGKRVWCVEKRQESRISSVRFDRQRKHRASHQEASGTEYCRMECEVPQPALVPGQNVRPTRPPFAGNHTGREDYVGVKHRLRQGKHALRVGRAAVSPSHTDCYYPPVMINRLPEVDALLLALSQIPRKRANTDAACHQE